MTDQIVKNRPICTLVRLKSRSLGARIGSRQQHMKYTMALDIAARKNLGFESSPHVVTGS